MSLDDPHNPFDLLGIDPRMSPQELTEALRQRAERALPEERKRLQGLWRQLTLKETDRIKWALLAHPKTSREGARALEELKARVPPFVSRARLPELVASTGDALVLPPESQGHDVPVDPPWPGDDS